MRTQLIAEAVFNQREDDVSKVWDRMFALWFRRLVYTQIFEPMADAGEGVITAAFEAHPEGTLLVQRELYPSKEALDGALASGMEQGMRETLEQLDELLEQLET